MSKGESISLKVVREVADREGVDPTDLHPPLHTAIDTEALDALFQTTPSTTRGEGTIEFQYRGYQIRVESTGEVQIGETISFAEGSESQPQPTEDTVGD